MTTENREQRVEAYKLLNQAIDALVGPVAPGTQIATDAVVIVGCQGVNEQGFRIGSTGIFVRDGAQPFWITRSLVREAATALDDATRPARCECCDD